MKPGKFTWGIFIAAALAACSKDNTITENNSEKLRIASASTKETAFITSWESGYGWNLGDSSNYTIYNHDRATPEITTDVLNSGAVLVWARNIPKDEGGIITKPQLLPLAIIPEFGRPAYNNFWYNMSSVGNATIKFRTNKQQYTQDPAPLPNSNIQFRIFIIPKMQLDQFGHTPSSISRLTYDELVTLLGEQS